MGKALKNKDYRGEIFLRHLLQDAGIECERIPLSGASSITPSYDLLIGEGQAEVKVRGDGFKSLYKWLAGNKCLFVKADYCPYLCVMTLDKFIEMCKQSLKLLLFQA